MLCEFQCSRCRNVKLEPMPYHSSTTMCEACRRSVLTGEELPPPLPPTTCTPGISLIPSFDSLIIALVFLVGVAVGAKMAGGW